ncbi:MAG: UDP-N-acetylmuramate dehydrogenase [Candidatus Omnitrophota bacterium]
MNWFKGLKGKIKINELLKKHTTFKIGGRADFFIIPKDAEDLRFVVRQARIHNIKIRIIGAGSNILVSDKGLNHAVVTLDCAYFKDIIIKGSKLETGSGALMSEAILFSQKKSLSGLEFLTGIPGSVGGSLVMNAGVQNKNIGVLVESGSVLGYDGKIKILKRRDLSFGYRRSNLGKYIILGAVLKLRKESREKILKRIKGYFKQRYISQEWKLPSAGCVFKNPSVDFADRPTSPAGRLIDACGLKGKGIGGAQVSFKHANFIINTGKAKAKDVLQLMELIKRQVKIKFNINLEPEIEIWK